MFDLVRCIFLCAFFISTQTIAQPNSVDKVNLWEKARVVRLTPSEIDQLRFDARHRFSRSVRSNNKDSPATSEANILGYGFNLVSEQPIRNRCILNREYQTIDNFSRYVEGRIVASKSEVDEFFSSALSMNVDGRYGGVSASARFRRDVSNSFQNLEQNNTVAFIIQERTRKLIRDAWPAIDQRAQALLETNTEISKRNFRSLCGDEFIDGVQYGREISLLLQVKSKTLRNEDMAKTAAQISANYMTLVSGDLDHETIEKYRQYQQDYDIVIKAYAAGEPITLSDTNLLNFAEKLRAFESSSNRQDSILSYQTSAYQVPEQMEYWQTFEDYRPVRNTMVKWHQFMVFKHPERCQYRDVKSLCSLTRQQYQEMQMNCANTYQWSHCYEPESSQCLLLSGQPCNQLDIMGELKWYDADVDWEQSYEVMFPKEAVELHIIGYEKKLENREVKTKTIDLKINLNDPSRFNGEFVCDLIMKEDRVGMCAVLDDKRFGKVIIEKLRYLLRD
ncbi:hypothetical protein BCV39_21240 [Vibrio sp. 10N.286.55.E10]|uniref:hypothetical protein n=1 Tax=unclassified Vibrio TaxID=2614977 RepID=UPI000C8520FF|nr:MULTISPECIES: hypothetical protein [unclassified Vibrio]PME34410.1 hypothetical protein BCV39_21240 [Vibrio sp. 10N.286.55.E10]PME37360.1 hypothetical protein BCV40_06645 [Vibrio sp. 10N.286.55.E12]PME67976.1 hypothetical protein BCV32_13920 [Vibrio sp. 10N.286.55.C11]